MQPAQAMTALGLQCAELCDLAFQFLSLLLGAPVLGAVPPCLRGCEGLADRDGVETALMVSAQAV